MDVQGLGRDCVSSAQAIPLRSASLCLRVFRYRRNQLELLRTTARPKFEQLAAEGGGQREFRFTAKLWKRFTHERAKAWTTAEVDQVREGFDVLMGSDRLGAVLLQFPWSFRHTEQNREWLGDVVRTFSLYPLVVEVRHKSWLVPDFLRALEEDGVGFVNIDQPLYHDSIGPTAHVTSHVGYVRVHGRNYKDWFREKAPVEQRYNYLYRADELTPWAERAREIASDPGTREAYVITNNHYKGKAVANALMLKSMVRGERVTAPGAVYETYRDVLRDFAEPGQPFSGPASFIDAKALNG